MSEAFDSKALLANERRERDNQRATLEGLSGSSRLSEDQKRYILASLYIQQRAERGTDPVSASRVQEMPDRFLPSAVNGSYIKHPDRPDGEPGTVVTKGRYWASQNQIMLDYCHNAVIDLEGYGGGGDTTEEEWYDSGPITSYSDLENLITLVEERCRPPFVIEVWFGDTEQIWKSHRMHSAVILGRNADGVVTAWEKSGFHMPYQLIPLTDVYKAYEKYPGWRVRPLAV